MGCDCVLMCSQEYDVSMSDSTPPPPSLAFVCKVVLGILLIYTGSALVYILRPTWLSEH